MKRLLPFTESLITVIIMMSLVAGNASAAGELPLTTQTFTLTPPLARCTLNGAPCIQATFVNNSNSSVLVIVYGVLRDSLGQMLYYTTGTVSTGPGQKGTVYLAVVGLPTGNYNASVFAVTTNGVAISVSSSIQVTL